MADVFADCVREATAGFAGTDAAAGSASTGDWTNMTAYPLSNDVSLWETSDSKPGQIQVRHQFPAGDERHLPQLARALSHLDEVEHCQATPFSNRLTVDFRSQTKELNGFLDRAEQSLEDLMADGAGRGWRSSTSERRQMVPTCRSPGARNG